MFDGVLCGQDKEWRGEGIAGAADGDIPFLHGFQQSCLCFGRGSVYLVGQHDVGKNGALDETELTATVENLAAGDVAGHQVGRELDAAERQTESTCQGADHKCFRKPGNTQQEAMAAAEDGKEQAVDGLVLAHNDFADFLF